MRKLELEAETIQISIYTNVIMNILKKHLNVIYNEAETVKGNDDYGNKKYTD